MFYNNWFYILAKKIFSSFNTNILGGYINRTTVNSSINNNFYSKPTMFKGGIGKIQKIIMQPDAYVSTYYKTHGHIDVKACLSKIFS